MYSVLFSQTASANQKAESLTKAYDTYTEVSNAVIQYFNDKKDLYSGVFILDPNRGHSQVEKMPTLLKMFEEFVHHAPICTFSMCIEEGDILHNVHIESDLCYCRDSGCDGNCGTLSCGCIDICRGRCGARRRDW